jgi:lysophospholipase L1-like esterase
MAILNRRGFVSGGAALALASSGAQAQAPAEASPYVIWTQAVARIDVTVADQTIRSAIRVTAPAKRLRLRISNIFGDAPLVVTSVHIGLRSEGARLRPETNQLFTFDGCATVVVPAGASEISDSVPFEVPALAQLLVSIAIVGRVNGVSGHLRPKDMSYLSTSGDHGASDGAEPFNTDLHHGVFIDALIAEEGDNHGTVAFVGDSITDTGSEPLGGYQGWVDFLANDLASHPRYRPLGLANLGISGNRLISERPGAGQSALARFDRDVLSLPGVHTVVLFEGINDIYNTSAVAPALINAHAQLAFRARAAGKRVIGVTCLPTNLDSFTPEREMVRSALNQFIRNSPLYDAVLDFERIMANPLNNLALRSEYDSGDRLHPSAEGYRAMASAVPHALLYPIT